MKILFLNSIIEKKSTGQIIVEMYEFFKQKGHEAIVCYGRGDKSDNKDFVKVASNLEVVIHGVLTRLTGLEGYYSKFSTKKFIGLLEKFKPEVVILGNIHGYYIDEYKILNYLKQKKINTYYYMFDEYSFLGKCAFSEGCNKYLTKCHDCPQIKDYPKSLFFDRSKKIFEDKLETYSGFDNLNFIGVPYTVGRARQSALFVQSNAKVYDFGWGIDTQNCFVPKDSNALRKKLNIPEDNVVILAVAPFSNKRKGIDDFYKIAESVDESTISFVHVGFDGEKDEIPSNVIVIPFVKSQDELALFFSMADLFVIPSRSEGYPTVCLDALSCGTPVCGYDVSGVPFVAPYPLGVYVEPFNKEKLKEAILSFGKKNDEIKRMCRSYAEEKLDSRHIYEELLNQIEIDMDK